MRGPQYHGYRERRRARRLAISLPWYATWSSSSSSRSGENDEQQQYVTGGSNKMMNCDSKAMTMMGIGYGPQFGDDLTLDLALHLINGVESE
ncbi:hypothetical protein R1flu_009335 [Riccia fluitans]|uniref:Uncharacterized protein n=1 Tax=Riccia fluitans TaxID=41844 RepID=A0ABD1Z2L5_9MARC